MSEEQFDWVSGIWTVLREQPETAVYVGDNGHVVIRQVADWCSQDDQVILVRPENAVTLANAIVVAAGLDNTAETSSRKPKTAAERQRLRRAKKHEETDDALKRALSHGSVTNVTVERDSSRDSERDSVTELPLRDPAE